MTYTIKWKKGRFGMLLCCPLLVDLWQCGNNDKNVSAQNPLEFLYFSMAMSCSCAVDCSSTSYLR